MEKYKQKKQVRKHPKDYQPPLITKLIHPDEYDVIDDFFTKTDDSYLSAGLLDSDHCSSFSV